jgi:hypothetical protein
VPFHSGKGEAGRGGPRKIWERRLPAGAGGTENFFRSSDLPELRGNLTSERGLGREIIVRFLDGVPGINDGTVQQQLANLKSSSDYARIVREVQEQIEHENKEALKELERAEREKARAEEEQRKAEAAPAA